MTTTAGITTLPLVYSTTHVFIGGSLVASLALLSVNEWLRRRAVQYPKSWLSEKNHKGILCMENWKYIVSAAVQISLIPIFVVAYSRRPQNWWYGGEVTCSGLVFASVLVGYYLQDSVAFWYENDIKILLHHIGTVVLIALCLTTGCWHGLLITAGLIYELGSLAMALVDLGFLEKRMGPIGMAATTIGGISVVLSSFVQQSPCDVFASCAVFMFLFGGVARLHMSMSFWSQVDSGESEALVKTSAAGMSNKSSAGVAGGLA